jgi:hypothetical protein
MTSNTNELDINSIEVTTATEDIVEFPLIPKKVVKTKADKKKIGKKVEEQQIDKEELLIQLNKPPYLDTKPISELQTSPYSYMIEIVEQVTTKYGDTIIATLDDEGYRFQIFLPKYYASKLSDEYIEYMNKTTIRLKYLGLFGKYNKLEFY